jgi:maltooligosyltrehalose trehalohydrolase
LIFILKLPYSVLEYPLSFESILIKENEFNRPNHETNNPWPVNAKQNMEGKIYQPIGAFAHSDGSCDFKLWCPMAKQVVVQLVHPQSMEIAMQVYEYGYWHIKVENCRAGTRYFYKVDDKKPFPDPASRFQPEGVHGPSEVVDFSSFTWEDGDWKNIPLEKMIFYELHTGIFSKEGTFGGIENRLDYLLNLGINTLSIMPVSQFPGKRNWGYDGVYPFAVQQSYGGPDGLMQLVNTCHKKGLAVVMDVVYNHLGPEGNYLGQFAPYFTNRYQTPWGQAINFDDHYAYGVRNYFVQNALMWFEKYHIDGLRLDAIHAIYDFSAKHIMQELAESTEAFDKQTGQKHYLIAESGLNDSRYINGPDTGGYGLDAQWNDDFHHGLHALVSGEKNGYYMDFENPQTLVDAYTNGFAYSGQYSPFRKRHFGNSSKLNPGHQFVVYAQNHDQVGNRKFGERLRSLTTFETLKLVAGALFISPYLPMLFMGEEYGENNQFLYFVDHNDQELNRLVREGRQKEFEDFHTEDKSTTPDPASEDTFIKSKLAPDPLSDAYASALFDYHKFLIHLKKTHPVLQYTDKNSVRAIINNRVLTIERWHKDLQLIAWLNFGKQPVAMTLPQNFKGSNALLLNSADTKWHGPGVKAPDQLSANEVAMIKNETMLIYSNA